MIRLTLLALLASHSLCYAGLEFDEILKEVQMTPDQHATHIDFTFKNTSPEPVKIAKYDAACSCTSVQVKGGKLIYKPGESGTIRAHFDMGNFSGTVEKSIQLWLDDDPANNPSILLTGRIHIPVLINLEPKTLNWDLRAKPEPKTITVTIQHEKPIHLLKVSAANDAFSIDHKEIENGKSYEITVTPNSTEIPAMAIVQIKTDCEIKRHANQRAFAVIRKPSVPRHKGEKGK